MGAQVSKTVNKANADHAVLFEAVNLILAQGSAAQPKLKSQVSHSKVAGRQAVAVGLTS